MANPAQICLGCLLGSAVFLPLPALAEDFDQLCRQRLPAPTVHIQRLEGDYSLDNRLSYRELTGMGAGLARHGKDHVLGLTRVVGVRKMEIEMALLHNRATGKDCVSPTIRVTMGYQPVTVFIGREFPRGTCAYREILAHEMRHVASYRSQLPALETTVRERLQERFSGRILHGEAAAVRARLKQEVEQQWLPFLNREMARIEASQATIDTAEEYDRMEKVCGEELGRLMSRGR